MTWADRAVQRRAIERQHTRRRHLSWVYGALACGLAAVIVASLLTRPAATWTPPGDLQPYSVWVTTTPECALIHTMYIDENPGCDQT